MKNLSIVFLLVVIMGKTEAASCSSNADCPHDQCCGQPLYDVLDLAKACQSYSKEGEACHGSILWANCDCEEGLDCVDHSGLFGLLHTSRGVCRPAGSTDPGFSIFGK